MAARMVRPVNSTSSTSTMVLPVTSKAMLRWANLRRRFAQSEIVAVHGNIEFAHGELAVDDRADFVGQSLGHGHAVRADSDKCKRAGVGIVLDDLVGHARQRSLQRRRVHDRSRAHDAKKAVCLAGANGIIERLRDCFIVAPCWPLGANLKVHRLVGLFYERDPLRAFRQFERCLTIQSSSARSKPISYPCFSLSNHL